MKEHIIKSENKIGEIGKNVRRVFLMMTLAIFAFFICCGVMGMTAYADASAFKIDAEMMPSGISTYDVRVTVENTGKDWEGTVRLAVIGSYGSKTDCAYDTVISLPQDSTKQFVVKVPKDSFSSSGNSGNVNVALINGNSNVAAETVFKQLLNEEADALTMGILSDDYSALTYLDMGGQKFYYYSDEYPIKLMELNQGNLSDSLETLTFLVIDKYNTGVLNDDEILAIKKWIDDGGVLIIGTGNYAEDTLRGFDYLGIECREVYEKGVNINKWNNESEYVEWSMLNMANLMDTTNQYYMRYHPSLAVTSSYSDGAVGVLPYSLSELGKLKTSDFSYGIAQRDFVYYILEDVGSNANSRYGSLYSGNNKFDNAYMSRRILAVLGNSSNNLNFGVLKFIVIVYVILVGPVIYLILRSLNKRDLYWIVVPLSALFGIFLVFFAGRGFEVVSTKVYSVTVCNLSVKSDCRTYMHCYDANHREWSLRLSEGYEYAGPQISYSVGDEDAYYYHIRKEGDRLFFGIKPASGFEDAYFSAGRTADAQMEGSIVGNSYDLSTIFESVTNDTNYDFAYFAVLAGDSVQVYKNLRAGETCKLDYTYVIFESTLGGYYYYGYMSDAREAMKAEEMDIIAALGMGVNEAYSRLNGNGVAIIGVTDDWEKTVDDSCSETSYGCLYMIQY